MNLKFPSLMRLLCALVLSMMPAVLAAQAPFGAPPLSGTVGPHLGKPTIHINGKPTAPYIYGLTDLPGGRITYEELPAHNIRNFCAAGVKLFYALIYLEDMWRPDGTLDVAFAQGQIRGVQENCPGAAVILRYHVHMPEWWREAHPEEMTRYTDRDTYDHGIDYGFTRYMEEEFRAERRESMASEVWRKEATDILVRFLDELQTKPEAQWLAGIHLAGGVYGEWHHWGFLYNEGDNSEPSQRYFRKWLTEKYKTDEGLRKAWNRTDVTLATARVPEFEERKTLHGLFREPVQEKWKSDYYQAQHELVPGHIVHFAKTIKETWKRPIIVGTFGSYFYSVFGRDAAGGNLFPHIVLESPHIDYVSSPQAYEPDDYEPGFAYRSRSLLMTPRLHGKLWLSENDQEAILLNPAHGEVYTTNLRNGVAIAQRNALYDLSRGNGQWWFDFGPGGGILNGIFQWHRGKVGYWDHPEVMSAIEKVGRIYDEKVERPFRTDSDVLLVYDTEVYLHMASRRFSDAVSNTAVNWVTNAVHFTGVAFDAVHIKDLPKMDLAQYKAVLFGNTYRLTDEEIDWIQKNVAKDGRHLIWNYGPGYTDGKSLSLQRASRAAGIKLGIADDRTPFPRIVPDSGKLKGAEFGLKQYGTHLQLPDSTLSPVFVVDDRQAEILGRFDGTNLPAVARKAGEGHTNWYSALPLNSADVLRSIFEQTGVHLYSERTGHVVYVGNGLIVLHSIVPGKHTLTLRNGKTVEVEVPEAYSVTYAFDADTGEPYDIQPVPKKPKYGK